MQPDRKVHSAPKGLADFGSQVRRLSHIDHGTRGVVQGVDPWLGREIVEILGVSA